MPQLLFDCDAHPADVMARPDGLQVGVFALGPVDRHGSTLRLLIEFTDQEAEFAGDISLNLDDAEQLAYEILRVVRDAREARP